jgi:hypothetical protein
MAEVNPPQLRSSKAQLDLVLLALEAFAGIGSDAVLKMGQELGFGAMFNDRLSLWRLRQSNPLRKSKGRKNLDIEEAQVLTLIIARLAQQYHQQIREAITSLERCASQSQEWHRQPLLSDYVDRFYHLYIDRMTLTDTDRHPLPKLALKLLTDLLFYSSERGERRLWLSLWDNSLGQKGNPNQ